MDTMDVYGRSHGWFPKEFWYLTHLAEGHAGVPGQKEV